jgi:hypothetical protein
MEARDLKPLDGLLLPDPLVVAARARLALRLSGERVEEVVLAISSPEFALVGIPEAGRVRIVPGDNAGLPLAVARLVGLGPRPRSARSTRRAGLAFRDDREFWGIDARVWTVDVEVVRGRAAFPPLTVVDSPRLGYWRLYAQDGSYTAEPTNAESLWRQLACLSLAPYGEDVSS